MWVVQADVGRRWLLKVRGSVATTEGHVVWKNYYVALRQHDVDRKPVGYTLHHRLVHKRGLVLPRSFCLAQSLALFYTSVGAMRPEQRTMEVLFEDRNVRLLGFSLDKASSITEYLWLARYSKRTQQSS